MDGNDGATAPDEPEAALTDLDEARRIVRRIFASPLRVESGGLHSQITHPTVAFGIRGHDGSIGLALVDEAAAQKRLSRPTPGQHLLFGGATRIKRDPKGGSWRAMSTIAATREGIDVELVVSAFRVDGSLGAELTRTKSFAGSDPDADAFAWIDERTEELVLEAKEEINPALKLLREPDDAGRLVETNA